MTIPHAWKVAHSTGASHIIAPHPTDPDRIEQIAVVIEQSDALRTRANARLLAAAPDLLAACHTALRQADRLTLPGLRPDERLAIRDTLKRILEPAIRRATH